MHTDASLVANNSQRCWMLHVASVGTPCCMLLHVIAVSLGVVAQSLKPVRLGVLKQCGAPPVYLAKVFVAIVRPVLQYAVSVWQNIPEFSGFYDREHSKKGYAFHISYARLQ